MKINERIPLLDEILAEHTDVLGEGLAGYKNHVYRMVHFCMAQGDLTGEQQTKITIAGCFHDIGVWTADTFDYLPPSIAEANRYLERNGLERWIPEIDAMIDQHHRLRRDQGGASPLVEIFRKGDLVDFSLGLVKCGISREYVNDVKATFPNAGFHKALARLAGRWICRHPFNPVPVLKW